MEKNKKQKAPKNTLIHEWVQEKGLLNNLPVYKIKKIQSSPVVRLSGPYDEEFPDVRTPFSHAFGRTTTTYPLDVESCRREGDPICDSYRIHTHPNSTLFCICDGCGWGSHVKGAAAHARDSFIQYMTNKTSDMKTVKDCAQVFVTALAVAHQEILDGAAREKFPRIGTTTLVGGVIVQLDKAPTPYGIVLVNIGDCKAFLYSKQARTIIDITAGNRGTDDASDPGGRIGPQIGQNDPDLRNLRFSFTGCEEGDLLLIMTDGVHDNFDPCTMGKKPTEIGLQEEKWEQVPADVRDKAKQKYMEQCLTQLVNQNPNHITPMHLSKKFINSAFEATAKSREWMEQHPTQRLPSDNALFPGKPDHATCAIMVVGSYDPSTDQGYKAETLNAEIFPF